jgi:hypothetical protein
VNVVELYFFVVCHLYISENGYDSCRRLRLLNVFEPCTLQVGDRNFYTFREDDTVIMKEQWRRSQRDSILAGNPITNGPASTLQQSKTLSPKRNKNKGNSA